MSEPTESTYVWRRINRAKLPLILDDDGDWVANPNIEAAARLRYEDVRSKAMLDPEYAAGYIDAPWESLASDEQQEWIDEVTPWVAAALTPGDTDEH